jgi:multiple sugar transport system substrate-binding protein
MSRRTVSCRIAVALGAVACIALAGCGDDGGGGGDGANERTPTLQLFGDAEELAVYRDLASAYERTTGDRMKLIEVADRGDHLQKLTTSFAGGAPPSAFLINYRNYGGYASRNVLDPAGPRLTSSDALKPEDFYPATLEAFTFGGQLQCMPQNASSLVVYYNRDLFRKAGLEEPAAGWTYEQFRAAAAKLTRGKQHGVGVGPEIVRAAPFVWAAGGELVDEPTAPTRFTLGTAAAKRGLVHFLALSKFTPSAEQVESKSLDEQFIDGDIAMLMSSRREVPTLRTIKDFDWDVAAFPRGKERATVLHSDGYCVSKGPDAAKAWEFVEFAVGPEGSRITAQGGRTVPSHKATAESDAFLDPALEPKSSQVFLDAIPTIRRLPISPNWPEVEDAGNLALEEAFFEGDGDVAELLKRIATETDGKF